MMTKTSSMIWITLVALLAGSPSLWAEEGIAAITRPSEDVTLSFVRQGQVKEVLVKEGDTVEADQKLVQLDDAAGQAQLAQLKAQAEDTIRIKAAEAQLDQKKVDLKGIQEAAKSRAATKLELEHAKLDVLITELSLALAKFEHAQNSRKYDEAKIHVSRMQLSSPIAGKVEQIQAKVGESVDELEDIIRIVTINPLWIDVPVPLTQAEVLKTGQAASVKFGATDNVNSDKAGLAHATKPVAGKIIHIASVADAASGTLLVRVEVPNPTGRPAGEHVYVSFTPAVKGAESSNVPGKQPAATKKE
jgi:RND family efflux transporter MFP subunit